MKITRIQTIQAPEWPHILWLLIHTDDGLVGLGETYHNAHGIRSLIVEEFAPR
jgi:galactonate dehydratase